MKKIALLLVILIVHIANAQTVKSTSDNYSGLINNINMDGNSTLTVNDNSFLYVSYAKKNYSIKMLDKKYKILWANDEIENFISAAIFNDNIIVFSTNDFGRGEMTKIKVTLLNKKNGKVNSEKDIDIFKTKNYNDVNTLTDSAGNFKCLLVRSPGGGNKRKNSDFEEDHDFATTVNAEIFTISGMLDIKRKTIDAEAFKDAQFLASACNEKGDLFFAYADNNAITIEKYAAGNYELISSSSANISHPNDIRTIQKPVMKIKDDFAWLFCRLHEKKNDGSLFSGKFDFTTHKGILVEDVENKDYLSQFDAKNRGGFRTSAIAFYNNKFITIKQMEGADMPGSVMHFIYGPIAVAFFDNSMHKLKEVQIDEKLKMDWNFHTFGYKITGNQLYIFYNYNNWSLKCTPAYQVINLDDFSVSNKTDISFDLDLYKFLFAADIVWFNNTGIFPVAGYINGLSTKTETFFKTIEFK